MKKMKKNILCFILTIICLLFPTMLVNANDNPTDEILNYEIDITPREDATLDIKYHIEWKVLESEKAGELTWVKVGLPNQHFDEVTPLTDNIKNINTTTGSSCYASIYFKESYKKDDIVTFEFSIHQDYMYSMNIDKEGYTKFAFTPGWFDEINVDNLTIRWHSKIADSINPNCFYDNNCYTWITSLNMGEKYTIELTYKNDDFNFNSEKDYQNATSSDGDIVCIVIGIIIIIVIIMIIFAANNDDYSNGSGFGRSSHTTYIHTSHSSHSSCAHSSCACACACACAGGGRAGCSTKDFYNTNLKLTQLKLKKKK